MTERDRLDELTREVEENVPAFTREDVGTLREFARAVENKVLNSGSTGTLWIWDLADRIEALLPPETNSLQSDG